MSQKSADPFRSTFSLLAGQGVSSRQESYSCHIEPLPEDFIEETIAKPAQTTRFVTLVVQLLAWLTVR